MFYPTVLKGCWVLISPLVSIWCLDGRAGGQYRKFILGRDIGWGCRCATSWSDLDLTFDLATVTLSLKKKNLVRAISRQP